VPILVVEVVSESTKAEGHRAKHAEYGVLEIPEYWIVDPLLGKVTVCSLVDGLYDQVVFEGDAVIESVTFPALSCTAAQVLAGR